VPRDLGSRRHRLQLSQRVRIRRDNESVDPKSPIGELACG
jgi:hypothetical protein